MALKPYSRVTAEHVRYISEGVVGAGYGVILGATQVTGGGQVINENALIAAQPTGQSLVSGKFLGVAFAPVVALDQTLYTRAALPTTTQIVGEPFPVVNDGEVLTNAITGTPTPEAPAYLQADGTFGPTQVDSLAAVGKFKSRKDADGYAVLAVKVA